MRWRTTTTTATTPTNECANLIFPRNRLHFIRLVSENHILTKSLRLGLVWLERRRKIGKKTLAHTLLTHRKWDSQSRNKSPMTESLAMYITIIKLHSHPSFSWIFLRGCFSLWFVHFCCQFSDLLAMPNDWDVHSATKRVNAVTLFKRLRFWNTGYGFKAIRSKFKPWTNLLQSKSHHSALLAFRLFDAVWGNIGCVCVWQMLRIASIYQVPFSQKKHQPPQMSGEAVGKNVI